jgi:hypothetical protein
MKMHEYVKNA